MTLMPAPTAARLAALATLLVLLIPATGPARAQERDTGRRRPEPAEPPRPEEEEEERPAEAAPGSFHPAWHLGVTFGMQGGTDLFRVETSDGGSQGWEAIGGGSFNASRFTATFDQDLCLGLFLARDLGPRWSLRADVAYARMDVAAEALTGQIGVLYRYDRMDVVHLGLGADLRLTSAPSHPFLEIAALASILSPVHFTDLGQTNLGGRVGLGYHQRLTDQVALRFAGRWSVTSFDVGDFRPPSTLPTAPEIQLDGQDNVQFFEIMIGVQATFGS